MMHNGAHRGYPCVPIGRPGQIHIPMFGSKHRPPDPPKHEPLLLVCLAVAIAIVLTLAYAGVTMLAERLGQGGL